MVDVVRHLFVYGTLLPGERNAGQIPDAAVRRRRPARVRGVLIDLGRYPALRVVDDDDGDGDDDDDGDDGGDVVGELLTLTPAATPALLVALDAFEGPGYARRTLPVHVDDDGATVLAWVFVQVSGGPDGPTIPDGDWRAWRRRRDRNQTL